MSSLNTQAFWNSVLGASIMAALLFVPAGTVHYWQAWLFMAVFAGATTVLTVYLAINAPALLERRMRAGPAAETQRTQKIAVSLAMVGPSACSWWFPGSTAGSAGRGLAGGMPLALGSWWALIGIVLLFPALVWRLLDEERFLKRHLRDMQSTRNRCAIGSCRGFGRALRRAERWGTNGACRGMTIPSKTNPHGLRIVSSYGHDSA